MKLPSLTDESKAHFDSHVERVEIVNANGELERVYFRFPAFCLLLTEESKQEILWGVDRETPGKQIQELLGKSGEMHREMEHQQNLDDFALWQLFKRHKGKAVNSMFALAVLQNAILLVRYSTTDEKAAPAWMGPLEGYTVPMHVIYYWANMCLGVLQMLSCIVVFALYALQSGVLSVQV